MARHTKRDAIFLGVIGFLGLNAYVAGVVAAGIYAATYFGAAAAAGIICLAAIALMLFALATLKFLQYRDRKRAIRTEAQLKTVMTLGTALLPAAGDFKSVGRTVVLGGLAYVLNRVLTSPRPQPRHDAPHVADALPPERPHFTDGAINPYTPRRKEELH